MPQIYVLIPRASGAGGQHNKTDSAVRMPIFHRVWWWNVGKRTFILRKAKAMALLVSRFRKCKNDAAADAATSEMRRDLVGSGDRSGVSVPIIIRKVV